MEYEVLEFPPRNDRIERTRTTSCDHWGLRGCTWSVTRTPPIEEEYNIEVVLKRGVSVYSMDVLM